MADDAKSYVLEPPGRRALVGLVVGVVLLAVAAGSLVLLRHAKLHREAAARTEKSKAGRPVRVVRVDRRPEHTTIRLPGEIRGYTETPVYAKVAGYLKRIAVDKGDRVKAGAILAELESPELDQQVRNARATYELKRVTNGRFEALRREGVVAQQEADQAQSDFLQARATLQQLEATQQYERITADADGVVTARYVDPGTLIPQSTTGSLGANMPIVAMATLDPLRVYLEIPQADAPFVRDGDHAVVTVTEYPGRAFEGAVTRHPQALTAATRTMLVEVDLPNPDAALLPGMYAQVAIDVATRVTKARIPDEVLIFRDGKTYVPVVDGDHLRIVAVELGYDDGRMSDVVDGLTGDEQIAMGVGQTAQDGEHVVVQPPGDQEKGDGQKSAAH
jgi:RND family efflux transporter MFP subunit